MKRQRYRRVDDYCKRCGAHRFANVDLKVARYETTFPSSCPSKDRCEQELISDLQIEPVKTPTGEIVR